MISQKGWTPRILWNASERKPLAKQLLAAAASAQGIETQALGAWFTQQQLNDPKVFLPQLSQRLEAMVGDQWLFDPGAFR
ncbi:hypothetical protein IQ254_22650 [Nodosilinea sp. LEGE 07088]|uniref:hypothetical protein n=1 Tax=Nodosilinea sp. LEGE 07088 TaxID=2777968 RepID=UPI00188196A7|nr:hypothetical protein [Nodosilinea sp. LEGE 07088]MBE9139960.1 hypothetical protein [Nodosilinea sp. LEGE 07088]